MFATKNEGTKLLGLGNASLFFGLPRMHEFFTRRFWVLPLSREGTKFFRLGNASLFFWLPRIHQGGQVAQIFYASLFGFAAKKGRH
ncbi:MAG: hypothetical protein CVU07_07255 [Bacteroidetes bacterium HGW-Bacteroidetes-23]|nr:MAG: hypothetical protein CVU07_07255 [Bacteroidetes bacterium HGW-Bacteroidetes-23]